MPRRKARSASPVAVAIEDCREVDVFDVAYPLLLDAWATFKNENAND